MENKKIYVDGVDVSECKYNEKESCHIYAYSCDADDFCTGNKNCYYKQLKRLQAKYDNLQVSHSILKTAYLELQEENERLEAELKKYEDMAKKGLEEFKDVGGCWGCGIQESLNQAWADCKTYRQALQEIRDIADIIYNTNCNYVAESHKIIAKINEVIGGVDVRYVNK